MDEFSTALEVRYTGSSPGGLVNGPSSKPSTLGLKDMLCTHSEGKWTYLSDIRLRAGAFYLVCVDLFEMKARHVPHHRVQKRSLVVRKMRTTVKKK